MNNRTSQAAPFSLSVTVVGTGVSWLSATGKLIDDAATTLTAILDRECTAGCRIAWLDLSGVPLLDRAGLEALVAAHRRFLAADATLILTGLVPRTARILELTGLDQTLFTVAAAADDPSATSQPAQPGCAEPVMAAGSAQVRSGLAAISSNAMLSGSRNCRM